MPSLLEKLKGIFSSAPAADAAELSESFTKRYLAFRSLLTANKNALELMAEIEEAYSLGQPFGMAFVRGQCTALSVNVFKMVQNLAEISGGRYGGLYESFDRISGQMEAILARQPHIPAGPLVAPMSGIAAGDTDLVGEKMANLGEVRNKVGLKIPEGFVITAAATQLLMRTGGLQDEINRLLKTVDLDDLESLYTVSARIQQLIAAAPVPDELAAQIMEQYRALPRHADEAADGLLVSMRSSAVGEDGGNASFAGQYRTQLNVSEEFILQTYKEIVAGKYRSQAIVYRHRRGYRHLDAVMCVGCMAMVDAVVSGVMFSRATRNPRSRFVEINAAPGLASQVVDGSAPTDFYRVGRAEPHAIEQERLAGDGPVLSGEQLSRLAETAIRLEQHFGTPQDIEWSIDRGGDIVILQSRPLRQPEQAPVDAEASHPSERGEPVLLSGGIAASGGVAAGPVFIVRSNVDLLEFPQGAVLVVEQPLPELTTLLGRAVAVVSEGGHVATHMAIVAREFGLPALFGARGALTKLKNGEEVTVDASGIAVYPGRNEELLREAARPANLMAGSPVYRILGELMEFILPLNLTDPGSPYFKSTLCRTLHDVTRFCHEKAVSEMFSFGEKARFDARAAKQLGGEIPFQWWVIDLDDGFSEDFDIKQKYVHMQDIVSEPMHAIWDGMTARPWPGPPPVSARGFGSILFRSTMNPSLEPAVRSSLAMKNYFLISKNFCNLSMRLGYHFTLVEAYLGEHLTENYVSFQFRGGAADRERRFERVFLLKDILEKYGFRVEVKNDALTARIEKQEKESLLRGLRVLGYLLIHTRQMDMVMGEKRMVAYYRSKISSDLEEIVPPPSEGAGGESAA